MTRSMNIKHDFVMINLGNAIVNLKLLNQRLAGNKNHIPHFLKKQAS